MRQNRKTFLWRYNGVVSALFLLLPFFFSQIFVNSVYAETKASSISVDVVDPAVLEIVPNVLSSTSASVTVTTDNAKGYKLIMQTAGDTSDMTRADGGEGVIPSITSPLMEGGYGYSVDGINFRPAPIALSEGDIVAEVKEISGETATTHEITFGVKIDPTNIPAGLYEKTFVFAAVVNLPDWCDPSQICYYANDNTDEFVTQSASSDTNTVLMAPDFEREGYGFAGWNTAENGTGTTYGPNETLRTGNLSESGLNLYANWVESSGILQNWGGCSTLSVGDVIALTDSRDNNTYAIAKLADGACWMAENLRLDLSNPDLVINAENTNNPTPAFTAAVSGHPSPSTSFCTGNAASCANQILFNVVDPSNAPVNYHHTYGTYYNWYTATAGNGVYELIDPNVETQGDICPAGWNLPSGYGSNGDYATLDKALGGSGTNATSTAASNAWRKYPNNFVYSGQQNGAATTNLGETGNYHGSTPSSQTSFHNLWLQSNKVSTNTNGALKNRGQTVRCIKKDSYRVHFDPNSELPVNGTMYDQKIPNGYTTTLRQNTFSITNQPNAVYRFIGWNTEADGSGDDVADGAEVLDLGSADEEITLYAQWEVTTTVNITTSFANGSIRQIKFENEVYGDKIATAENNTVTLVGGNSYTISAILDPDYDFVEWEAGENITLGDTTDNPTTFVASLDSTLTATTEFRNETLYLQNLADSTCTTIPKVAYDTRDGSAYHFQRLADGKCWLLDNLQLGATDLNEELSSENTNMPEDADFALNVLTPLLPYTTPGIDISRQNRDVTNYGIGGTKAGIYYNYCAASAGTVCSDSSPESASYDICPKGWRLPTGGGNGEYARLYNAYNNIERFNANFSISLTGWYDANAVSYKDFNKATVLWTSTPSNNINKTYVIHVNATTIKTIGYLENNGFSIRCVKKE